MRGINKIFILYFLPALSIICLMGCTSFTPYRTRLLGTNPVFNKNYELNVKKTTYVGNSMIRVKNYHLSRFNPKTLSPNVDITIKSRVLGTHTFYAQNEYAIVGKTVKNGIRFCLIEIKPDTEIIARRFQALSTSGILLLISENGEVDGRSLMRNPGLGIYQTSLTKCKAEPPDAKFIENEFVKIDSRQGYENYELIYTGNDNDSFHITYREYSLDDFARTAFFQNLTYPSDAKVIRFKGYKILVDDATSESITFAVTEEGLVN